MSYFVTFLINIDDKTMLQITGPFLHIGLVVMMTALTWLIAGQWMHVDKKGQPSVFSLPFCVKP